MSALHDINDPYDEFVEALGIYIGPSNLEEVEQAIHNHSTGPVIGRIVDTDNQIVGHLHGWAEYVDALGFYTDENGPGRFILSDKSEARFNPVRGELENKPIRKTDLEIPDGEIDRYVGGFAIKQASGQTLWIVLWHNVLHETETGDIAPGMGPFETEVETDHD